MSIQNSSLLYLFLASKKPPCTCFSVVLGVQWGTASWRMQHTSAFNKRFLSDRRRKDTLTKTYSITVQQLLSYSFTPLLHTHEARWGLFCSAFISEEREVRAVFRGVSTMIVQRLKFQAQCFVLSTPVLLLACREKSCLREQCARYGYWHAVLCFSCLFK